MMDDLLLESLPAATAARGGTEGELPGALEGVTWTPSPRQEEPGSPAGREGAPARQKKSLQLPGRSASARAGGSRRRPQRCRPAALPPPPGCAERMRCLRVNRACFPFTPSGSVFMKNFLLLTLWEYSFLACTARG